MIAFQLTSGLRTKKMQGNTTSTKRMATNSSGGTSAAPPLPLLPFPLRVEAKVDRDEIQAPKDGDKDGEC